MTESTSIIPMMDGGEIEDYMTKDPLIKPYFKGVYATDEIERLDFNPPYIIIVNTQPSYLDGKHWICMFIDQQEKEYFDSLGNPPLPTMKRFLTKMGGCYQFNKERLQHPSTNSCGHFCLYYSYYKCRGYSMKDILNKFNSDLMVNSYKVNYFYQMTS